MLLSARVIVRQIERWGFACACAALLGLASAPGAAAATAATGWRVGDHGAITRFVIDLDAQVPFKVTAETGPDRVRVDLPGVEWQFGHQTGGARPDGVVGAAEFSDPPGPGSHITLWLKGPARVNSATLVPPSEGFRYRLVIDLEPAGAARAAPPPPPKPAPPAAASRPPAPPPKPIAAAPPPHKPEPASRAASPPVPPQLASSAPPRQKPAPPLPPEEERAVAAAAPPPAIAVPAAAPPTSDARPEPAAAPGPPLALRAARVAIEVPPPPLPPPPSPPAIMPRAQAAPVLPPPALRSREAMPPPPSSAPLPRITSTPLPIPAPRAQPAPPQLVVPATAQLAALPPIRIIRMPGRPVMVILPLPPAPPKPPPPPPDTRPVIVLDPGHGGVDPGATGLSGVHEKAITLAFATELQHQLEDSGRYRVLLTRTEDSAVALRERVRIARAAHADLFLSIHADTLANHAISGLSVYTESETASDRETEALATKENKADLIAGIDLSGAAPELTSILIDLAQRETLNRSGQFAAELVQEMGGVSRLLPRTHRSAGFAVLTAPDVPSVLLELGYLSNKADERGLTSPHQRARLAGGIVRAIDRLFAGQPPLQRS